ncbi:hypothetical protein [Hymenobacter guriensis]|uniref:DUF3592 domain-containing protein n=1 Tax=Hymenobacter guriensis TaxID=2793065 RepID=A0ABS0L2T2_9BACT|nr:hypothetical protein [Hymenobacter guriensis]MBG8553739.1 hypothetical protein [Hymenobacter guriensis]
MWQQFKRYIQLGFGLLLSCAVLLVSFSVLREATFDLTDVSSFSGILMEKGKTGAKFTLHIANCPYVFQVYKITQNYDDIDAKLTVGNEVKVYFNPSSTGTTGNSVQIYQLVQNGRVIIDSSLIKGQNRNGGLIGLIGGLALVIGTIREFRKRPSLPALYG